MCLNRLATYGTLAPGRPNNHQLADLKGRWMTGTVKGRLLEASWGANFGYPGLVLEPAGREVEIFVFESEDLPDHWKRLDEFEGDGYERVQTYVQTSEGELEASIYVLAV